MTMKTVCTLLPADARQVLIRAASIKDSPSGRRAKAIDRAIDEVKRKFPEHFRRTR
ncbi:hypothetical protein [Niveibacterium terrae]|uniref:hypothetical protein n=1 Tax=Niveibacterium terrae TaxID=3373598 RepID=UPI003A8D4563